MSQWYLSYDGQQMGPMESELAIQQIQRNPNGYAWREGFASWVLMSQVPELQGPGKIWLQSLPFSRLAGRMLRAAPQRGGSSEEGSVLGTLGNLIGGNR